MITRKTSPSQERRYPLRMPQGWEPPVPAWSSVFPTGQEGVSMAVIGFQHPADMDVSADFSDLHAVLEGADICDMGVSDAGDGLRETMCIAYWRSNEAARTCLASPLFTRYWERLVAQASDYGVFKECMNIPFKRSETLFSGPVHDHGYSQMRKDIVGPINEHMYWGGMRDRIAFSANDPLESVSPVRVVEKTDRRVVVEAHENLCVIRSGQDWSHCEGEQLAEYLEQIEPVLRAGMNFLRDEGNSVNCYATRYIKDLSLKGEDIRRSCGLAYFRTMKDLEEWAEHHPTHLEIFNTFLSIAPKYGPDLQLRLWHEVSVLPAGNQLAEYVNCRDGTGLLSAL